MGKMLFKMAIIVAIMAGISNYMLYIMTGKSPFDFNKISMPDVSVSIPKFSKVAQPSGGKDIAYKWTDENGVVHYSTEAPPEHSQAKKIEVDPNANVVQATKIPKEEKKQEKPDTETSTPDSNIYSPSQVKKVVDDAKNVEKLLQDRFEAQEKSLEGI